MAETKTKRSPVILFLGAFVVVVIVMFIANQSKDVEVALEMSFNEGIRSLSSYNNKLLAVASDGKTFLWDWDKLDKKPETGSMPSEQVYLLAPDVVALIKQGRSTSLVVSNFRGDKIEKSILLDSKGSHVFLIANRNQSALAAITAETSDSEDRVDYQFLNIDLEGKKTLKITGITDKADEIQLEDFAVSDDGRFIVGVGKKDHRARLVLVDIEQRCMLWDKTYDNPDRFGSVIFSFDSKTIFAGGSDGAVYWFRASDGELVDHFRFKGEAAIAHKTISVRYMTISPDSFLLAYTYGFKIYVFDLKTKREIHSQRPSQKLPGPLAFSPDSNFIATSDLRQGGKIKIYRIPVN
ncbi:MAG: WD40 repeat domain-containing protein [Planctomycetota bacterium]|jgi:WD40 repeat protein